MSGIGDVLGEICKAVFPIPEESYAGSPGSEIAVCTLSSVDLLRRIAGSRIMADIAIAGRLFSENRGIDALLRHLYLHGGISTVLVCGREVRGHMAGHSLLQLHRNGTGPGGRIVGSASPEPFLAAPRREVAHFRDGISLVDWIGVTDVGRVEEWVSSRFSASPG